MRAETGSSRPSVWDDRPRIDKAGQNRRSDGWKSDVYCQPRQAVKVIEEYCKLMNHKMGDCEIVIPLENREALRNITMSIPNNSILKNGEVKESKPRKK